MPSWQLLSRRLHGSGAVRCWILPKLAWCEESERVHSVSRRVGLRNWLDLARPVRSRYSRAEHFVERVRRVRPVARVHLERADPQRLPAVPERRTARSCQNAAERRPPGQLQLASLLVQQPQHHHHHVC